LPGATKVDAGLFWPSFRRLWENWGPGSGGGGGGGLPGKK